jgi:heat shock protein HslJ
MKNLSILILVSIFALSCSSKTNSVEAPKPHMNRVWMLVAFKDYNKDYFVEKKAFLDMTNSEIATSKMGCNSLSFSYSIKDEKSIQFSQGIATRMYCQDHMKLETDFLKDLKLVKNYKVEGHFLTLTTSEGEKMRFVAQDWD